VRRNLARGKVIPWITTPRAMMAEC